jgi:predicted RNA-binding Zn-ribbon protein involved in translation (DUF1610 family)
MVTNSERYRRSKARAKAVSARARELAARADSTPPVCAYCGERPAKRCPAGDGKHVGYRCSACWPKTVA